MLKNMSYDKLVGTTLGQYHLRRSIGQSKLGPIFLAYTDTTTTYLEWTLDQDNNDCEYSCRKMTGEEYEHYVEWEKEA